MAIFIFLDKQYSTFVLFDVWIVSLDIDHIKLHGVSDDGSKSMASNIILLTQQN